MKVSRLIFWIALLGSVLVFSIQSQAQTRTIEFVPSLLISQSFDDNILANDSGGTWDTATLITPSAALSIQSPASLNRFEYSVTAQEYWRTSTENSFSHTGLYDGKFTLNPKTTLTLTDRVSYSPTTTLDTSSSIVQLQISRRQSLRNTAEVSPRFQLTERTQLDLAAFGSVQVFEQTRVTSGVVQQVFDTYEAGGRIALSRLFSMKDTISARADGAKYWFDGTPNSLSYGGELGWSRQWLEQLSTSFLGGVAETITSGDGQLNAVGSASIGASWANLGASAAYNRAVNPGSGLGGALLEDSARADLTRKIGEDGSLSIGGGYYHSRDTSSSTGLTIHGVFVSTALELGLRRDCFLGLNYQFRTQRGNAGTSDLSRNLVAVTLRVTLSPEFKSN